VRRLPAPVMVLLGVLGAAPAAAEVVTLRPPPGPSLAQGPVLVGERVAWAQRGCLTGCGALAFDGETDSLYEVRTAGDGAARTLFRARDVRASSGPRFFGHTFSFMGSSDCRARFGPGVAAVRRGVATVRLRCPRGCYGDLTLRHMGWQSFFSLAPGETELRVRLRRPARRRLERHGVLEARAVLETYDRARDRRVRRRALRLVLRP
jgi:hypothetical protein